MKPAASGKIVRVVGSQYGRVLADARGQAFYLFAKERSGRSECYGACSARWPPVLTKGEPRAHSGGRRDLLGTTRRRDGKLQVTYRGHPLYYYDQDSPGRVRSFQRVFEALTMHWATTPGAVAGVEPFAGFRDRVGGPRP